MNVTVDEDKCCGAGQCVLRAPEVFAQREDRIVMLLQPEPAEHLRAAVVEAVGACPMGAIEVRGYVRAPVSAVPDPAAREAS
jgi:ferredoxin